jgi:hypothetical protein
MTLQFFVKVTLPRAQIVWTLLILFDWLIDWFINLPQLVNTTIYKSNIIEETRNEELWRGSPTRSQGLLIARLPHVKY